MCTQTTISLKNNTIQISQLGKALLYINIHIKYNVKITILTSLFLWIAHNFGYTQKRPDEFRMKQDLASANAFIASYRNDTARIIIAQLMDEVNQNLLDSPFGLKVQLAHGTALEHDDHDSLAMQILLHVKERSSEIFLWDVFTQTCIALALLHENMERSSQSLENLQQAQYAISQYGLDALYPAFAVRMSSYYRVFTENKDSSLFYAQEALRTAPKFKSDIEEATAHMLMLFLLRKTSYEKALEHVFAGLRIFQKLEDYTESASMYNNISRVYYEYNNIQLALAFNDSTIAESNKAIAGGFVKTSAQFHAYQFRGTILKTLGQTDSAWYYLNKGHVLELEWVRKTENHKVAEVDARYNDEKKVKQIEAQAQQIKSNAERKNRFLAIGFLIILFAAVLFYYYIELRRANLITKEQEAQLRMLDATKSHFFANVSHELRTPLTLVLGPIHTLLKENQLTEKQSKLLHIADRNGRQLEQLVNEILDLRKLEMGKMRLVEEPTELSSFFNRYVSQFESLAEQKQIDFSFDILIDKDLVVQIDRDKYRQILYNLLSNAFKFTPTGGKIKAMFALNDNTIQLEVADSGRGIHPDDLPYVFDRFFQSNQLDRLAEGGTGIGLALCKEYTQLFGGHISVESTLGEGAIFKGTFPVSVVEYAQLPVAQLQADDQHASFYPTQVENDTYLKSSSTPKPTILVVEDNPELQRYIGLVLEEKYHIITADNGKVALEKLNDTPSVDLILSDLMMPVMDGFQLLERLKSDDATRHIPTIILTARAEATDKLKALRIGVDDYITKPFNEEELVVRIENLLKNKAVRQQEYLTESEQKDDAQSMFSEEDRAWLETFETYVQKNFSKGILSVPILAQAFTMSESTLLRQLKRLTGLTPVQYLQEIRLNEARQLLENRIYKSITQVASEVGYQDARSFSRSFKQRFGKLPSDFLND